MSFENFDWDSLFPSYLQPEEKNRLQSALKQFKDSQGNLDYSNFYFLKPKNYFMQSDIVQEIRYPFWNGKEDILNFEKKYCTSIILTNTCDISMDNDRIFNKKQCLFAPIINLETFVNGLKESDYEEKKLITFIDNIKRQNISNLFFLPANHKDGLENIVLLDKVFWFPTAELNEYLPSINEERLLALNHFGFYLFMLKLSYHMCRLPEACDRKVA